MPERVMVFVDGPNADNQACAWGAMNAFNSEKITCAGVIISATAVNYAPNAPLGSRDIDVSRTIHTLHTARMAGLFHRAGVDIPVFSGLDIEDTDITSPIPHSAHVQHEDYDIFGDANGEGGKAIAGDFNDALRYMQQLDGQLHLVVGGPFSEIPLLLEQPSIASKMGHLAAQAGFDLSERAIYSKLAFNVDVDLMAALKTLLYYPNNIFAVPSDITRHPSATFKSAEELIRLGVHPEIGDIFIRHRARAEERHKKEQLRQQAEGKDLKPYPSLSIHDLQAVLALSQSLGLEKERIFEFDRIRTEDAILNMQRASQLREKDGFPPTITPKIVKNLGYIGADATIHGTITPRYVAVSQNALKYKQRAHELLKPKNQ